MLLALELPEAQWAPGDKTKAEIAIKSARRGFDKGKRVEPNAPSFTEFQIPLDKFPETISVQAYNGLRKDGDAHTAIVNNPLSIVLPQGSPMQLHSTPCARVTHSNDLARNFRRARCCKALQFAIIL